ncbi:B7 like protein 6 [Fukomys damarensis]|uniref:B7 like protein 6 n=1 Tax=Fukomys damarensis TaxID=885580 RepID=A0A091CJH5_FUKDA|nr:B7 like protein 6 [Fukomys damarensis]
MGVTWYRKDLVSEAEVKVFELYGDQQNAFRCGAMVSAQRLKRGDASLQLPGVGLGDAGEYRCELTVTPQKAKGWVLLEVLAKPDSTVFLEKTKVSGKGRHLVCQSSGFYPEAINITWEKWTQKVPQHQVISKDICTGPTIKNKDGVFSITSYLKLNASLEDNGTIYQCVVEHPSLSISQKVNFTLLVIGSLSVEMPGRSQIAYVNGNVTLSCQIPGCPSLDTRIMGVTWYRKDLVSEAEIKVFELYGDQQKAFRRGAMVSAQKLKRGDASLQLPGVGLGDAGEYRCELTVTPQKAKGWVLLEVLAKLAITLKKPIVKSNGTHLVCQSSGFSPESISITWVKWTQKAPQSQRISKDNVTGPTVKNEDGVFSITSYLKLNACLEDNGTIYQCVVEYPSLSISQKVNFTLPVIVKAINAAVPSQFSCIMVTILSPPQPFMFLRIARKSPLHF